jgi:hypothetical protein
VALKSLRHLDLGKTTVTDRGVSQLAACNSLKSLSLMGCTKVTNRGVNKLRRALRQCQIHYE